MKYPHFKNILVPGPPGLKAEFKRQGFNVDVNTFDRTKTSFSIDDFDKMDTGESDPKTKIDAVIASTDTDFNFYRECFMSPLSTNKKPITTKLGDHGIAQLVNPNKTPKQQRKRSRCCPKRSTKGEPNRTPDITPMAFTICASVTAS